MPSTLVPYSHTSWVGGAAYARPSRLFLALDVESLGAPLGDLPPQAPPGHCAAPYIPRPPPTRPPEFTIHLGIAHAVPTSQTRRAVLLSRCAARSNPVLHTLLALGRTRAALPPAFTFTSSHAAFSTHTASTYISRRTRTHGDIMLRRTLAPRERGRSRCRGTGVCVRNEGRALPEGQ